MAHTCSSIFLHDFTKLILSKMPVTWVPTTHFRSIKRTKYGDCCIECRGKRRPMLSWSHRCAIKNFFFFFLLFISLFHFFDNVNLKRSPSLLKNVVNLNFTKCISIVIFFIGNERWACKYFTFFFELGLEVVLWGLGWALYWRESREKWNSGSWDTIVRYVKYDWHLSPEDGHCFWNRDDEYNYESNTTT